MPRHDEAYVDRFEWRWALAAGVVAFVSPWLVVLASDLFDGLLITCLLWVLGALVGIACLMEGRRSRRIERIGTAMIVGELLGVLLLLISLCVWLMVSYASCGSCGD